MSKTLHVAILGAGVCGLYAGRVLSRAGFEVTVLESEDVVGGLAAGRLISDNYYDLGVHHLHEFDREIFEDIQLIMGSDLLPVAKSAMIRYGNGYRRYPLEFFDLLLGIPPWTLARALGGMIAQQARNKLAPFEAMNAEEALIQLYGRPLYSFFFRDFTHRYWGIPPEQLSAAFVRRKMPRLSAVDMIKKALSRFGFREDEGAAVESALADETLHYSRTGSRELPMALAEAIRAEGGRVLTSSPVASVETVDGRVRSVTYERDSRTERLDCDYCVSTIPLPALAGLFSPAAPVEVRRSAGELRFRPLVVYGLLVRRERVLDALYIYFRNRVFHRVAEPKNSELEVKPSHYTVLLVEMTCGVGDDRWNGGEETRREIVRDLEAEGLVSEDEIVETHVVRSEYGYPLFELGFEPHFDRVMDHVDRFANLWTTGRQGGFCYPNMHGAMRMGADAAQEVMSAGRHEPGADEPWRSPALDASGISLSDGDLAEVATAGAMNAEGIADADGATETDPVTAADGATETDPATAGDGASATARPGAPEGMVPARAAAESPRLEACTDED